jgi:hypothetical protein
MNLSIEIPQDIITINKNDIEKISNKKGVYYLYNKDEKLIYIGKSKNVKSRIKQHLASSRFKAEIFKISYFIVETSVEIDIYETYLIDKFKPIHNVGKTFYKTDERDELRRKQRKLELLKKKEKLQKQEEEKRKQLEIDSEKFLRSKEHSKEIAEEEFDKENIQHSLKDIGDCHSYQFDYTNKNGKVLKVNVTANKPSDQALTNFAKKIKDILIDYYTDEENNKACKIS